MLVLLSPAKTLDFESPSRSSVVSQPALLKESSLLIDELKTLAPQQLAELMSLSDKLSTENYTRYQNWQMPFNKKNAKQALLTFKGDVYTGMNAETMSADDDQFAQQHVRILSGLYGVLKPLDLMQPYRLEMGTALANERGKNLYQFWGSRITDLLNNHLTQLKSDTIINLASNEYFKAVDKKLLKAQIITPVFKDWKNGKYKVVSFFAKKARGLMTRYIIDQRITDPAQLQSFDQADYHYNKELSDMQSWVFTRKQDN